MAIETGLAPAHAAKTALHEAAHVLLHTTQAPEVYVTHRGITETEAEAVAYIVADLLGLDTSAYSIGYVAGWADGDTDTIRATAARVLTAAQTLTDAITAPPLAAP
ncbi:hypothetical protein PU560_04555 [Georgenia sp. 10Sc9-8]|uniref:ImmA/IrrE family metallo-endopeptidase n=1 Tax=Georgenia halotolerans TaxID=3028317 RepID=A0ABT5TVK8_9MICO|nr:hypothetical protein [Georgenia halotolerans]